MIGSAWIFKSRDNSSNVPLIVARRRWRSPLDRHENRSRTIMTPIGGIIPWQWLLLPGAWGIRIHGLLGLLVSCAQEVLFRRFVKGTRWLRELEWYEAEWRKFSFVGIRNARLKMGSESEGKGARPEQQLVKRAIITSGRRYGCLT